MPFFLDGSLRHRSFITGYEPEIDKRMNARISLGDELMPEERAQLPRRVYVGCPPTRTLTLVYSMISGPYILPPAAHAILMDLEPEGHVFHELEAMVDGVSLGPYFLQLQTPVVDCVDIDRTTYFQGQGREYFDEIMAKPPEPGGGPPRIALYAERTFLTASTIGGRHWWRAPRRFNWEHFCSEELKRRFSKARISGLQFQACRVSGTA